VIAHENVLIPDGTIDELIINSPYVSPSPTDIHEILAKHNDQ